MATASRRRWSKNSLSRRPLFEILEQRAMLATYTFNGAANTLAISLGNDENLTVQESSGDIIFALSSGTFVQSGGDAAPGSGTGALGVSPADLEGSLSVNNSSVSGGGNTVTFSSNFTFTVSTLSITLTDPDADSAISFTDGMDVTSSSAISLAARRIVAVNSGSVLTNSGDGGITISGNRQATQQASNTAGVVIQGEVTTTGPGSITLRGRGGTGGFLMPGVFLFQDGKVRSTATGDSAGEIIIDGIGGTNPGSLVAGVYMDTNSLIQSVDGDIRITGVSGNVASSQAFGFYIPNTGIVESTGAGAGAAKITIDGTGLSNSGINMQGTGNIRSVDGAIELIGEAPPTGPGIHFLSQTPVVTTGNAPVSLISNRINLGGGITAALGAVSLTGKTSGRPIVIGSIGSTTELGLTDTDLDRIATRHLQIGDSSSGDVTLAQEITRSTDVSFTSGTKIDVNSNITLIAAFGDDSVSPCDLTFDAPMIDIANGRILIADGSNIDIQGGTLNVGDSPGSFTAAGRLNLASGTTYHAEIGGLTPGVDHDYIIAQGQPTIDSATLDLDFSFTPAIGDSMVLIDNRSGSPISGRFANLPDEALFAADGMVFQIFYNSGFDDNKDVLITRVTPPDTAITSFTLINADTEQPIRTIVSGDTIDLASLPTTRLNIRADTNAGPIESVRFGFDGNNNFRVENIAPYALFSDKAGNYHAGTLGLGGHTLSATPFAADNAGGAQGVSLGITFSVIDSAAAPEIVVLGNSVSISDGDTTPRAADHTDFGTVTQNGVAVTRAFFVFNDGNTDLTLGTVTAPPGFTVVEQPESIVPPGLGTGFLIALDTDTVGTKIGDVSFATNDSEENPFNFRITGTVEMESAITSFTLINADTDQAIRTIGDMETINLASLPTTRLNIRANTNAGPIESVRFGFDGNSNYRVENLVPYALFSDQRGNYHAGTLGLGNHTLSATPFAADNATGSEGTSLIINFFVMNQVAVTGFTLINADTDQAIRTIGDMETIDLASLPTANLNIRADTDGGPIESVRFGFDGNNNYRVENLVPYALFSDQRGNYHAGTLGFGGHTLSATPFSGDNATGDAGTQLTISFIVVDSGGSSSSLFAAVDAVFEELSVVAAGV